MSDKVTSLKRLKSLANYMIEFNIDLLEVDGIKIKLSSVGSMSIPNTIQKYGDLSLDTNKNINDVGLGVTKRNDMEITPEEGDQPLEMTEEDLLFYSAE